MDVIGFYSVIGGDVKLPDNTNIGTVAGVVRSITFGKNSSVGMFSIVHQDLNEEDRDKFGNIIQSVPQHKQVKATKTLLDYVNDGIDMTKAALKIAETFG